MNPILLLALLNLILMLVGIAAVANSNKPTGEKVLWIIIIVLTGLIGAGIYLSLRNKEIKK